MGSAYLGGGPFSTCKDREVLIWDGRWLPLSGVLALLQPIELSFYQVRKYPLRLGRDDPYKGLNC